MPGFEWIDDKERAFVNRIFDEGGVFFRHGFDNLRQTYFVKEFERSFKNYLGKGEATAVSSGTAALRTALAALDLKKGDEVITQSFTFVATVEAIIEAGATPIVVGIDDSLNMNVDDLEKAITPRTKAIIAVHMLGHPCDIDAILHTCNRYNVALIEDVAWGLGAKYRGQYLGTFGDFGCFSFDHAKAITTGEGGLVLTNNPKYAGRCDAWHDHGHENNPKLPRWKDSRSSSGFNFRMTELQGAIGLAQLKKLKEIVDSQRNFVELFIELAPKRISEKLRLQHKYSEPSYDALLIDCGSFEAANEIREDILQVGMGTKILPEAISWHYASEWEHIPSIKFHDSESILKGKKRIQNYVALPVSRFFGSDEANKFISVLANRL